jgi:hypothetical protein
MTSVALATPKRGGVCLVIHRESGPNALRASVARYCEIVWTEEGVVTLEAAVRAQRLVELAISSFDGHVSFDVYVDNVLQERGRDVVVKFEMHGPW